MVGGLGAAASAQAHYKHHARAKNHIRLSPTKPSQKAPTAGVIQIDINPAHALNTFTPNLTLGASVDAIGTDGIPVIFTPSNIQNMLSAGGGSLSDRLYTELNVQDWHWNPTGTWSDAAKSQGYFTGSSSLGPAINDSYGFLLTHRGSTYDQGDNQDYSRITDGDPATYWKSNPYLTSTYTKESDTLHPQWVLVDLGSAQSVNAVKIQWSNPYAISYAVQYWTGHDALYDPTNGQWTNFANGVINNGAGGTVTLKLGSTPTSAQFIRVVMTQSSNTYDTHGSSDPRNKMGYAIAELGVGTVNSSVTFTDLIVHSKSQNQTPIYASSTDPWHASTAQNPLTEQIGFDYMFNSPLSRGLPMLVAAPMIYSTPDNAVAEVAYLNKRGFPLIGIELGEEPDGQFMTPEDYGAFYVQWANAIHAVYPDQKVGGPVLSNSSVLTWTDAKGNSDWMSRFVGYLISHSALQSLSFVSTEHYPFAVPSADWSLMFQEPNQVQTLFDEFSNALVPSTVPVYVTEYNLDSGPTEATVDIMGAAWHAMFVGEYLNRGGKGAFYYQDFPVQLATDGTAWGLLGMFTSDANDQVTGRTSQYYSNVMINRLWCLPGKGQHTVLPVNSSIKDGSGNIVVYPYAVLRPDGLFSVLLINADSTPHTVSLNFNDSTSHSFSGLTSRYWLNSSNYAWHANGINGYASPNGPIEAIASRSDSSTTYTLTAHSITIIRGKVK